MMNDRTPLPREIPFTFADDIPREWIPGRPELVAMFNGASLTMPYLEPFLIRTMAEANRSITDPFISETVKAFNAQEGQHFQTHRRFNEVVKAQGYADLAEVEKEMEASYARLNKKNLRTRLAYTAGFEAMTLGVTKWLIENRTSLFTGADTRVASFILWHMVEETEHKCVAHDAFHALYAPSLGTYFARAFGVFHGSLDVMRFSRRGYIRILKKDGRWKSFRHRARLMRELAMFAFHVAPYLFRAALPGHNPRHEKDPDWVLDWLALYPAAPADKAPLVDTASSTMPVPFSPAHQAGSTP